MYLSGNWVVGPQSGGGGNQKINKQTKNPTHPQNTFNGLSIPEAAFLTTVNAEANLDKHKIQKAFFRTVFDLQIENGCRELNLKFVS